jgi:hypothetical protein
MVSKLATALAVGTAALAAQARRLRAAVRAAGLSPRYMRHARDVRRNGLYELVLTGVRTGDIEDRSGWESQLLGTLSAHKLQLELGQV